MFTNGSKTKVILIPYPGYLAKFGIMRYNIVIYSVICRRTLSKGDGVRDKPPDPLQAPARYPTEILPGEPETPPAGLGRYGFLRRFL